MSRHLLAVGFVWSALIQAQGGDVTLTGLTRLGGTSQVFFSEAASGRRFSLAPGESCGALRLLAVDFGRRAALVADAGDTNWVAFSSPRTAPSEKSLVPLPSWPEPSWQHGLIPRQGSTADRSGPGAQTDDSTSDSAASTSDASSAAIKLVGDTGAGEPTGQPDRPQRPPPRRAATADELFKARNGYAAWEELLRERNRARPDGTAAVRPVP